MKITLCSFIQFPITFSHKSPSTDQHKQFPNPVYSLSSMSHTKCHTHIYQNTT